MCGIWHSWLIGCTQQFGLETDPFKLLARLDLAEAVVVKGTEDANLRSTVQQLGVVLRRRTTQIKIGHRELTQLR